MIRLRRLLALSVFGLLLSAGSAFAQDEPVEGEGGGSSGNPVFGYVGTAFLGAAAIFVMCKTARR